MGVGVKATKNTNFKKTNSKKNILNSIPTELITEIVARVAAHSSDDLFNTTLSCKTLCKIADDSYIIQHVSLDKLDEHPWTSKKQAILDRCANSGNPEAIYRLGIMHYFGLKTDLINSGLESLRRAANLGHHGALYVIGIILILDGSQGKQVGMKIISDMKKFKKTRKEIKDIRRKFSSTINRMWSRTIGEQQIRPTCCTRHEHKIVGWTIYANIDYNSECEACCCDYEIIRLWNAIDRIYRIS